jgi:hypothetical protein
MIRTYRVSGFCFFLWVLFERFLLPIPIKFVPPVSGVVSYCVFWTVYCFVYSAFELFYSFTYVVGLNTPNLILYFWGMTPSPIKTHKR